MRKILYALGAWCVSSVVVGVMLGRVMGHSQPE
jgi:hypothetical protein